MKHVIIILICILIFKSIKGENVVQDDFELVCFDLVSSPSTPGAYVFKDPSERDQFQEEVQEKPVVEDRMKRLMGKLKIIHS